MTVSWPRPSTGSSERSGKPRLPPAAVTWLALVAFTASYPKEIELDRRIQRLLLDGPAALVHELHLEAPASGRWPAGRASKSCESSTAACIVDVTHTASHDLHTGIQRVVRETVSRWLDDHELVLCGWDYAAAAPFALPEAEVAHFQRWRSNLGAGEEVLVREPVADVDEVLVPWRSVVVLPELVVEPTRTDGYRALVKAGVAAQLSMIGYDLIPVTISETVTPGMSSNFANYLSVVKHIDRVSCISLSSASEFQGFASMLGAQGLAGPHVVGQPLPSEAPDVPEAWLAAARRAARGRQPSPRARGRQPRAAQEPLDGARRGGAALAGRAGVSPHVHRRQRVEQRGVRRAGRRAGSSEAGRCRC